MGLAESTPSVAYPASRRVVELVRSPSVPARVSALLSSKQPAPASDDTGRVAVLSDGSCAFYRGRRRSQPAAYPADCHHTCHPQCRDLVTMDGQSVAEEAACVAVEEVCDPASESLIQTVCSQKEPAKAQMLGDLRLCIQDYNVESPAGLGMTLEKDGSTFRGFIRVNMNLCRPISVAAGTRPPSIYDILKDDETLDKTLTSFYLPRDTVKALHVTSETTTHEVIVALLKKFKVVDNPRRFALYERYYEQGETAKVKMHRIAENEKPLVLALRWSRERNCNRMFVLQENETGDILWDAFSLPELSNFLRILDREEEEYKRVVRQKYQVLRRKIQEAMDLLHPGFEVSTEKQIEDAVGECS